MSAPAARAVAVPVPPSVLVWQFGGKAGNLTAQNTYTPNSGYNMFCKSNSKYLTYATQPAGINLGYTENAAECKVHFQLPDHQQREILTGEPVALGIGGGDEWLYYSERPLGINYKWRSTPKFEHRIWGPTGESGKKIQQNT